MILDRKNIFEISNYVFFKIGHVTPSEMEMSSMSLRIEWKHSRIPAGPASGRNHPLKGRIVGFGHEGPFFRSFEKFGKWEVQNFVMAGESKLFVGVQNRSEVIRVPQGRASLCKGSRPGRKVQMSTIVAASYPIFDLASSGP